MLDDKISEFARKKTSSHQWKTFSFLTTNKHGRREVSCKLAVHQMACTTTVLTRFDGAAFPMRPLFKGGVYPRAVFISKPHDFLNHRGQ